MLEEEMSNTKSKLKAATSHEHLNTLSNNNNNNSNNNAINSASNHARFDETTSGNVRSDQDYEDLNAELENLNQLVT